MPVRIGGAVPGRPRLEDVLVAVLFKIARFHKAETQHSSLSARCQ